MMKNTSLYNSIVSHPMYFKYYLERIDKYFQNTYQKIQCDIIHAHHPLALWNLRKSEKKKILTIHTKGGFYNEVRNSEGGIELYGKRDTPVLKEKERFVIDNADFITFPSQAAMDLFYRQNDVDNNPDKVRIIYNGVDVDMITSRKHDRTIFQKYKIRSNASMYVLNVAEHIAQKNIMTLLSVVASIKQQQSMDIFLINIGKGNLSHQLNEFVLHAGLHNNVSFLGHIPNDDILDFMKMCNCFVLTSYHVIFDLVVLEALASGMPVIVSDEGGNREIIKNGYNGYLVDSQNTTNISEAIVSYNKEVISSNAAKSVKSFSIKSMISQYEQLYKKALTFH